MAALSQWKILIVFLARLCWIIHAKNAWFTSNSPNVYTLMKCPIAYANVSKHVFDFRTTTGPSVRFKYGIINIRPRNGFIQTPIILNYHF